MTGAIIPQPGIADSASLAVTANGTPNMSVNVAAGRAFIAGTEASLQGTYMVENDATVNKTISASDSTNPRWDIVVAKVQDSNYSGATNAWSIAVVTGTPAGSPAEPALPANSIKLARVIVTAGATTITSGNIVDYRPRSVALGGTTYCTSNTRPSSPFVGQEIYESDTYKTLQYVGASMTWKQRWNMPWGVVGRAKVTANQTGITTITDLTGLSVTWTAVANRVYRIWVSAENQGSVVNDQVSMYITDSSNVVKHQRVIHAPGVLYGGQWRTLIPFWVDEDGLPSGTTTRKVRLERTSGTGTVGIIAGSALPAQILVEDIGNNGDPS